MTKRKLPLLVMIAGTLLAANTLAYGASGTWAFTGSLHTSRDGHTATLLPNGTVLVAGGELNGQAENSSEVYSASTLSWSAVGNLNVARNNASAVVLPSGSAIVMGGCTGNCQGATTASSEIYTAVSRSWTSTGNMVSPRAYFGAVLLSTGKVLVAGGCTAFNANGCSAVTARAELYDPNAGTFSATGSMAVARGSFSLTVLPNGKVLAAGGETAAADGLSSCELYDPNTGKWTLVGRLNVARGEHGAILLSTGNVLVVGGNNVNGVSTVKTELYNYATGKWTLTGNMNIGRVEFGMVILTNGNVLVSGGTKVTTTTNTVLPSSELYNPSTGIWTKTGNLNNARTGHSSTLLTTGSVLDASGSGATQDLKSAEIYTP
jgi:N-acetylneuraminic acid mutarotase